MGYPEDLYKSIDARKIEFFLTDKRGEDLHLEFATVPKGLDKDGKAKLAKALSGFANSDGGVVIWGVRAKRGSNGVDAASEGQPLEGLSKFVSDLNSLTGQTVSPIVEGVLHKPVPIEADRGYAATFVPRSDRGPHMGKFGGYTYYKRSGSSFYPMEHFDLEDMFGRRPKAALSVFAESTRGLAVGGPSAPQWVTVIVTVGIENAGRGMARDLWVWLELAAHCSEYEFDSNAYRPTLRHIGFKLAYARPTGRPGGVCFVSELGLVVHPGMRCPVTALNVGVPGNVVALSDFEMNYEVGADGVATVRGTCTIAGAEIHDTALGPSRKKG